MRPKYAIFSDLFWVGAIAPPIIFTLSLALFCMKDLYAQKRNDAGLWTTINLETAIYKRLALHVAEEIRLKERGTRLDLLYTSIGLEYKVFNNLKTELSYRFTQNVKGREYYNYRHRLQWDISLENEFYKFGFSLRHRLQSEVESYYSSSMGYLPEYISRSKFQLKYNLFEYFAPYSSVEVRYQIRDPRNPESDKLLNRLRYQIGGDFKLNSRNKIGIYYLKDNEFNLEKSEAISVIGLEYSVKFK